MSMFVKKPVVISAVQWTGENLMEVIAFMGGKPDTRSTHAGMKWDEYADLVARDGLKIYTLEGKMSASLGDWIIRGVKGEYYPCKPDIFTATYEPVGGLAQGIPSLPHSTDVAAPERMWREQISPSERYPDGGTFYHETKPALTEVVEYICADLALGPNWQPIETAPKDETVILLFGGGTVAPGFFYVGDWRFWDGGTIDDYEGDPAGFFNGWIEGYGPTHWMPLPDPPET